MTVAMNCELYFKANDKRKAFAIRRVKSVSVNNTWRDLTDTAIIEIPRAGSEFEGDKLRAIFAVGDEITIKLGYNGTPNTVFEGFVTKISATEPVVLECEDLMWKVKQEPVNYAAKNLTLPVFLNRTLSSYTIDAANMELGTIRFANTHMGKVMQKIKEEMGIYCFIADKTVTAGKIYSRESQTIDIVIENSADNQLEYNSANDKKVKVKAISTLRDGTKLQREAGDSDGTEVTLSFTEITSKTALQEKAEDALQHYKYDGYTGHIECFGTFTAHHGDTVNLQSVIYPDRDGIYYIDKIEHYFDDSPKYTINIYPGPEVS